MDLDLATDECAGPEARAWASVVLLFPTIRLKQDLTSHPWAVQMNSLVITWLLELTTKGGVSAEWQTCL